MLLGGVVDEDIEPLEFLDGLLDRLLAEGLATDIAFDEMRLAALALDQAPGFLGIVVLFVVDDGDLRTFAGEQDGRRTADAGVASSDQRNLVEESAASLEARLVIRLRRHCGFLVIGSGG